MTVEVTTEVVVTGGSCVVMISVVPDSVIVLVTVEAGSVNVVVNVSMLVDTTVEIKVEMNVMGSVVVISEGTVVVIREGTVVGTSWVSVKLSVTNTVDTVVMAGLTCHQNPCFRSAS